MLYQNRFIIFYLLYLLYVYTQLKFLLFMYWYFFTNLFLRATYRHGAPNLLLPSVLWSYCRGSATRVKLKQKGEIHRESCMSKSVSDPISTLDSSIRWGLVWGVIQILTCIVFLLYTCIWFSGVINAYSVYHYKSLNISLHLIFKYFFLFWKMNVIIIIF